MKFKGNPYYHPEKFGLEIFDDIDDAGSYEFNKTVIWKKLDDNTLLWDYDSGCSCPSPFDGIGDEDGWGDDRHDLKPLTKENYNEFEKSLHESHPDYDEETGYYANEKKENRENKQKMLIKIRDFLGIRGVI